MVVQKLNTLLATLSLVLFSTLTAHAQPVALDGVIGLEWAGITPVQVTYNPAAPLGNFGSPGPSNHLTGYEIFLRRDDNYVYTALRTTGPTDSLGLVFSNLSFALRYGPGVLGTSESRIGFEVTNDRAFSIDGPTIFAPDNGSNLIRFATFAGAASDPDVIEGAFHWSIFLQNQLGVANFGLPPGETAAGMLLYRSQSFGYSVAGGPTYGPTVLGFVSVPAPEPSTLSLLVFAGAGLVLRRRRA